MSVVCHYYLYISNCHPQDAQSVGLEALEWIGEAKRCCESIGGCHGWHWDDPEAGTVSETVSLQVSNTTEPRSEKVQKSELVKKSESDVCETSEMLKGRSPMFAKHRSYWEVGFLD